MTFSELLAILHHALHEASDLPPDPSGLASTPLPRVICVPSCQEAKTPDELLIGVGHWQRGDHPITHRGVCLNNKGAAERFGRDHRYATVTDLALDPPEPLARHWESLTANDPRPLAILRRFTLIVEDISPDSCLALLCWLARCSGVDVDELRMDAIKPWAHAVHTWETTGMAGDPLTSWTALLSVLGHSYLSHAEALAEDSDHNGRDVSHGWRAALRLTVALLRQGVDPSAVPEAWDLGDYVRARAFLDVERQEYLESLDQATRLQLWVPLAGHDGARCVLVDAYFAVETWSSGARKLFVRADREHTYLGRGFALMGLDRPGERGSGADMTVSVNPWTGIHLQALWVELERLESACWDGRRPCDRPRPVASYSVGAGYDEPWWDDSGRYTVLGAPKALPDWPAGSRLDWPTVVEAAWRCYSPVRDLRVRDLLSQRDCLLTECRRDVLQPPGSAVAKHLVAVGWLPDATRPQALFRAPTTQRALMALAVRERAEGPLALADLPSEQALSLVPLSSGFALLHERGILLFSDWTRDPLPLDVLREEIWRCTQWLSALREVERGLSVGLQARPFLEANLRPWRAIAILADLTARRAHLASAQYRFAQASPGPEIHRFRTHLSACWGIDKTAEDLHRRLAHMEDAIRTTSTLRTQGLLQILSVYGLPFFLSGGIVSLLGPWLETLVSGVAEVSFLKIAVYLGLAAILISGVRILQFIWARSVIRRARPSPADSGRNPPSPGT